LGHKGGKFWTGSILKSACYTLESKARVPIDTKFVSRTAIPVVQTLSILNFQEGTRVMKPMASDRQFLTVRDVGDLLRVHPTTVYKLVR
jgi:hypothetical protein